MAGTNSRPPAVRLGLKENWRQFSLLVLVNAFVGAMVGDGIGFYRLAVGVSTLGQKEVHRFVVYVQILMQLKENPHVSWIELTFGLN